MISTKAKLLNVLSISQSLTLPQLAITETIKKLIEIISVSSGKVQESPYIVWERGIIYSLLFIAVSEEEATV